MIQRLLWMLVLCWGSAYAQQPVQLERGVGMISLSGRMTWQRDMEGTLTPELAHATTAWQPLVGEPGFGFTKGAIWLRFEVAQASADASWRLEVNNPLIEDVRLYLRSPSGGWLEQRAGWAVPHGEWPVDSRNPVFRLDLPDGTHEVMLRLATRTSLSATARLWEAERYHASARNEAMLWGIYFGLYGLVILIQLLFWSWTREAISGWYVPYAGLNFITVFMTTGYPQNALGGGSGYSIDLLGVSMCAVLSVAAKLTSVQLELPRVLPRFDRLQLRVAIAVSVVSSVLVLSGHYGAGVGIAQIASIIFSLTWMATATVLLRRGHPPAPYFLVIFGIFCLGVLIRYLRNLGVFEPSVLTDYSAQTGSLVHMVMMCVFIVYHYNSLRIALHVERKAHQEQGDFVAMVSHEYRTPLAIINTSIQQLAANLDAPRERSLKRCANIKTAVTRMGDLMDKYLSAQRLEDAGQSLQPDRCDPRELMRDVVAQWPPKRVRLALIGLPSEIVADRPLLEIVLGNLLSNADRHASPDGVIEMTCKGDDRGGLSIAIVNQGDVIPAEELPHLFRKYFRGRASRGKPGAGLGLFLVKRIVELHGGRIPVTSQDGRTAFKILLPAMAANSRRAPVGLNPWEAITPNSPRRPRI